MADRPPIDSAKLAAARIAKGLRAHELAVLAKVSPSSIHRYERSDAEASRMNLATLAAIAGALEQPVSAFFADEVAA